MNLEDLEYIKNKRNFLTNIDWLDENFTYNFLYKKLNSKETLNKKKYRLSEENISSRVIYHWQKFELITDERPDLKGWRIFSLSEIIWIHIIIKLRSFGLDLHKIKRVKEYLDIYHTEDNQSKFPLLDFYILYVLSIKKPAKLIVFDTGESMLARQSDINIAKQMGTIQDDYISIDLNQLVSKGLKKKKIETDYLDYSVLPKSPLIKQIEESISEEDIQSITIKVKDKDYIIDEEFFIKDRTKANALMSVLDFGRLIENKNEGKSTYQVTNKKKIKKG